MTPSQQFLYKKRNFAIQTLQKQKYETKAPIDHSFGAVPEWQRHSAKRNLSAALQPQRPLLRLRLSQKAFYVQKDWYKKEIIDSAPPLVTMANGGHFIL